MAHLSLDVAGEAQEVGSSACVSFDAQACQAMGAACDKVDRFAVRRNEAKLSQSAEPASCKGVVSEGKDAVLFAPALLTLD